MRTVLPGVAALGDQAETLPARSLVRNSTSVCPSDLTSMEGPAAGFDQGPPLVDVRCWYPLTPLEASVPPPPVTVTPVPVRQDSEPPVTLGGVGAAVSTVHVQLALATTL